MWAACLTFISEQFQLAALSIMDSSNDRFVYLTWTALASSPESFHAPAQHDYELYRMSHDHNLLPHSKCCEQTSHIVSERARCFCLARPHKNTPTRPQPAIYTIYMYATVGTAKDLPAHHGSGT